MLRVISQRKRVHIDTIPSYPSAPLSVRFVCGACGTILAVPMSKVGTSGACPRCGTWIDGVRFISGQASYPAPMPAVPMNPAEAEFLRKQGTKSVSTRIRADGYLDHEYNDRKELHRTIRVLAFFLAAGAILLIVTFFMRAQMAN